MGGGDLIMSNATIKELQTSNKRIDTYLEIDSINSTLLKKFIHKHAIDTTLINYINKDQAQIANLKTKEQTDPTIIVTYVPYNLALEKNGFKEIASIKDNLDLTIVDAMFITSKVFRELKKVIERSILSLQKDPKEFYEVVQPYMLDMSFKEFQETFEDIVWINKDLPAELKQHLNSTNFPTRDLI